MSDERMNDGQKLVLTVALFLILKGLLDPKDAEDQARVKSLWKRAKDGDKKPANPGLWEYMKPW